MSSRPLTLVRRWSPIAVVIAAMVCLGLSLLTSLLLLGQHQSVEPIEAIFTIWLLGASGLLAQGVVALLLVRVASLRPPAHTAIER